MDSTNVLFPFFITSTMFLWAEEYVLFTLVLLIDQPFDVFGMFEFLLIKVGVGGLVHSVASIWVGNGVVAFGWMGNGAITFRVASGQVGSAIDVVLV
jgi:hypothetical protein